jgi:hypothetical protein
MERNGNAEADGDQSVTELYRDPESMLISTVVDRVESGDINDTYGPAQALDRKVVADPSVTPDVRDQVEPLLDHESTAVRRFAAIVFEQLAGRDPEVVTPMADSLIEHVDGEDVFVRRHVVWAIAHCSTCDPEAFVSGIQDLVPDEEVPPYIEREHLVTILKNVSTVDPAATLPMLPALFEVLAEGDDYVGTDKEDASVGNTNPLSWLDQFKPAFDPPLAATDVLLAVSETTPESIVDHVQDAAAVLEDVERVTVRREVVEALANVAQERPADVTPAISQLAAQLDSRNEVLQARSARALGLIYDAAPAAVTAAVTDNLSSLEPLLESESPNVRVAVASLFSCVADEKPDAIREFARYREVLERELGLEPTPPLQAQLDQRR